MKNAITSIILHTHTHTQRNTLSNKFLRFKFALGVKRCQGFFFGIDPSSFQRLMLKNELGFFILGR